MTADTLCREGDGCQRVLDLVGDAACDLAPCRLLLRGEQVREIFEDDDVSQAFFLVLQRRDRDGERELGATHHDLGLAGDGPHAIRFADEMIEIFDHVRREQFLQRSAGREPRQRLRGAGLRVIRCEQSKQRVVGAAHAAISVERQHAGGNALQDGLDLLAALIERHVGVCDLAAGRFDLLPRRLELRGHLVERVHQLPELVGSGNFDAVVEMSARDLLGGFGERRYWPRHQLG